MCGGVAAVLHGVERMTMDIDLSLDLDRSNLEKFISVMKNMNLKPRVPVPPESILDPLGMMDTKFYLTPEDRLRFQPLHIRTEDGFRPGTRAEDELYYDPDSQLYLGGEGLVSTMNDFGRFCRGGSRTNDFGSLVFGQQAGGGLSHKKVVVNDKDLNRHRLSPVESPPAI